MKLIEILEELIRIESVTGNEGKLQEWLKKYLEQRGFEVKLQEVLPHRPNLYAQRGSSNMLIATHADTVPAWEHPYAFLPFQKDGRVYGRGAIDTKGQIASLLKAIDECDYPCEIAIFVDEEKDGRGSESFVPPKRYDFAIVLEPTELKVAYGEMGGISLEIEVKGKFAHGSTPYAGKNAIEEALDLYQKIKEIALSQKSPCSSLNPWINLGKIEGGRDSYVVPDYCRIAIEIGILPGNRAIDVFEKISPLLKEKNYHLKDIDDPIEIEKDNPILELIASIYDEIGLKFEKTFFPSWSDAHNLATKGIPSLILGAGKLELAHTPSEFVDLKELEQLKEIIKALLRLTQT
ncbi:MAG: M20/M25/M40 family metallo-hydrolase [Synergistetes bacterium]|nr:M20/M25/M40 family metallo-hydrolase [Synergistota bacterium]